MGGKCGSGNIGTVMQGWKMREWKYRDDLDTILQGWKMRELTSVQWQ